MLVKNGCKSWTNYIVNYYLYFCRSITSRLIWKVLANYGTLYLTWHCLSIWIVWNKDYYMTFICYKCNISYLKEKVYYIWKKSWKWKASHISKWKVQKRSVRSLFICFCWAAPFERFHQLKFVDPLVTSNVFL